MNGFANHAGLSEDDFGESKSVSFKAFDAFRKFYNLPYCAFLLELDAPQKACALCPATSLTSP